MGEKTNAYTILVEKSGGKIQFGRHRRRFEDDIKMDLPEIVWDGLNCSNLG
jgi:hypothetical protein